MEKLPSLRAEHQRREARCDKFTYETCTLPQDPLRPSRPKAGLGLVMIMLVLLIQEDDQTANRIQLLLKWWLRWWWKKWLTTVKMTMIIEGMLSESRRCQKGGEGAVMRAGFLVGQERERGHLGRLATGNLKWNWSGRQDRSVRIRLYLSGIEFKLKSKIFQTISIHFLRSWYDSNFGHTWLWYCKTQAKVIFWLIYSEVILVWWSGLSKYSCWYCLHVSRSIFLLCFLGLDAPPCLIGKRRYG